MKRFLRKRWHHLPVGVITAVLLVCLLAGGVFAAFNVFMGNANVTVVESITVTNTTGDSGEQFTGLSNNAVWDVSIYPGQTKTLNVLVSNASPIVVSIGASGPAGLLGVTATWSNVGDVAGNGSRTLTLTVTATTDASPSGPQAIFFAIFRG